MLEWANFISSLIWGPWLIILLIGTGIYLTLRTGFIQIFKLPLAFKAIFSKEDREKGTGDISSWGALSIALAATVGTGSIVGIATAVYIGGPGALFWIFIAAFVGMATKYSESLLAVRFRVQDAGGQMSGGPMYYIERGMGKHWKWMAIFFAFVGMFTGSLGAGVLPQVDIMILSTTEAFGLGDLPSFQIRLILGLIVTILVSFVTLGGVYRIAHVSQWLLPFLAFLYIIATIIILCLNLAHLPQAFSEILNGAFSGTAAVGGFTGSTLILALQIGVRRGIFSTEAGQGTAPIAAAAAKTNSCVRQGLISMLGNFFTLIIGLCTGLILVNSGLWNQEGITPANMTTQAFSNSLGSVGYYIVFISLILFSYTTIIGWNYYASRCVEYLFGIKGVKIHRYLFSLIIFACVFLSFDFVWILSDILNGLMIFPNLIALLVLTPIVLEETNKYFHK